MTRRGGDRPALAWVALICLLLPIAAPAHADSLRAALTDAYRLNRQIAAERAAVRGKDELVPEAKANLWRPHVFFEPQGSATWTAGTIKDTIHPPHIAPRTYTEDTDNNATDRLLQINMTMNIFDSGMTAAQVREAKALIGAERGILEQTEEQVFQSVATQYANIVLNDLQGQAALETKRDTEHLLTVVTALAQQHFATVTAVAQVEQLYLGANAAYVQAEGAVRAARAQFRAVVGRPAGAIAGWPPIAPMAAVLPLALKIAASENPQVATARSQLAAARASLAVAKSQLLPVVSMFGTLSHDWNNVHYIANNETIPSGLPPYFSDTNTASAVVGLRMTMPLYQGGTEYANVRQQIDAIEQNQQLLDNALLTVRGSVAAAWHTLVAARLQYRDTTAEVAAARRSVAGLRQEFSDGTASITDVLTEERNLSSSLAADAQAGYSYFNAVVAFNVAIGRFDAKDLKLPVTLYDPLVHYNAVKDKLFGFGPD